MSTTDDSREKSGEEGSGKRLSLPAVMRQASEQLADLVQCEVGAVSAIKASDNGWSADVEVLELERVPDTMSVMASYHVELDSEGSLVAYERVRRYARGQIDRR
ncbi:gas vesicle protein [Streptomyces sp. t39]|uniref:gas vesicle protein GvpO n=1 Tax=Streptomyces sp. t39 TaxID=1828156 RepID=UPI0011CDD015|nr:gas vesicle protein [Streptomyces sp. t39]TXS52649.1 gas vesicle protein [Streptomyces sp. t39]